MNVSAWEKQIIAMGGGGFTMEPGNPLLDDFILGLANKKNASVCLLPTASGDHPEYIREFYKLYSDRNCMPSHLTLYDPPTPPREATEILLKQDIIYISGGHTGKMLAIWKRAGIDDILRRAWEAGVILAGVSSGAVCWFREGLTDSNPERLSREECLGFLEGSFCAHYENEGRRPAYFQHVATGRLSAGFGVDNFAALHITGTVLKEVVSSRPGADAYRVRRNENGKVDEEPLPVRYLGG